jgi:resuscitation-promoting factor RpfB
MDGARYTSGPFPAPLATSSAPPPLTPVVTTEIVTVTEMIPFNRVRRDDPSMDAGTEVVTTGGVNGVKTLTYEVAFTDGVETSRTLVNEEITSAPVDEVTSVGTREPPPPPPE